MYSKYSISNSSWTPEEKKRFMAPVSKPAPTTATGKGKATTGAAGRLGPVTMNRPKQPGYSQQMQGALKKLLSPSLISAAGEGYSKEGQAVRENTRAIKAQRQAAQLLAGLTQTGMQETGATTRTGMQNRNRIAVQDMQNRGQLAVTKLAGQNQVSVQGLRNKGQLANTKLVGQNQMSLADKNNQFAAEQNRFRAAVQLMGQNVPGEQVDVLANTPGSAPVSLSGINVPQRSQENKVGRYRYIQPQEDLNGNPIPGTEAILDTVSGQIVDPNQTPMAQKLLGMIDDGQQEGESQEQPTEDDKSVADNFRVKLAKGLIDPENLTADDEIGLKAMSIFYPDELYEYIKKYKANMAARSTGR